MDVLKYKDTHRTVAIQSRDGIQYLEVDQEQHRINCRKYLQMALIKPCNYLTSSKSLLTRWNRIKHVKVGVPSMHPLLGHPSAERKAYRPLPALATHTYHVYKLHVHAANHCPTDAAQYSGT